MRWLPIFPNETAARPVMERLALLDTRLLGVYLHRFPATGGRPIIPGHDHPWGFVSVVLAGGYDEASCWCHETPHRRGHCGLRRARAVHRIRVHPDGCLTLCIRGPKRQDWSWQRLPK